MIPRRCRCWLVVPALAAAAIAGRRRPRCATATPPPRAATGRRRPRCTRRREALTLEPGLVAFNLATARYHLAPAGDARELPAAEAAYRSCLSRATRGAARRCSGWATACCCGPAPGGRSTPRCCGPRSTATSECRREPDRDARLAEAARHNEQRARLLLLQVVPRADGPPEDGGGGGEEKEHAAPDEGRKRPGEGDKSTGTEKVVMKDAGQGPTEEKDGPPRPGKGTRDAGAGPAGRGPARRGARPASRWTEAARRILEEWRAVPPQRRPGRVEGARDW